MKGIEEIGTEAERHKGTEVAKNLTASVAICNPDIEIFSKFIASLKKYTPELAHLIIIDNASESKEFKNVLSTAYSVPSKDEEGTKADALVPQCLSALVPFKITIIENKSNFGFGRAHNLALKKCQTPYFAILNDDIEFYEPWAGQMLQLLKTNPGIAQVGPRIGVCNALTAQGQGLWEDTDEPEYCEGSCFIMPTKLARQFGLFDERYEFAYFEDTDLSLRLRKEGYLLRNVNIKWKHHRAVTSQKVEMDLKGYHINNEYKFKKRWNAYLIGKKFGRTIVIKRSASLGDVFLITPVIEALKLKEPDSVIMVMTQYPQAIEANNDIDYLAPLNHPIPCDEFINLDYAYEKDFTRHIVDAYADVAGVKLKRKTGILYVSQEDKELVDSLLPDNWGKSITIDYSDTWGGKAWDKEKYNELSALIKPDGYKIIGIGLGHNTGKNYSPELNLVNALTPLQTGMVIAKSALFIGHEGLLVHFAQAVKVPAVALYGCTTPELVNTMTPILHTVVSPAACRGCRHRYAAGTGILCSRNFECMNMITVEMVYEGYRTLRHKIEMAKEMRLVKK